MEDENREITNIEELVLDDVKELTLRRGSALELHHPRNLSIEGTISAPSRFIVDRNEDFQKNKSHCMIKREGRKIELFLNEDQEVGAYMITGKITLGNKYQSLGINSLCTAYTPEELSRKLKMLRSIFLSKAEHSGIVSALKNLKAKVKQEIDQNDDKRGNVNNSFSQTVESNIPDSFKIKVPLLEGEDAVEFEVQVILEAQSGNDISCFLESIDAADMIEEAVDKRMDEEIKLIEPYAVIIES